MKVKSLVNGEQESSAITARAKFRRGTKKLSLIMLLGAAGVGGTSVETSPSPPLLKIQAELAAYQITHRRRLSAGETISRNSPDNGNKQLTILETSTNPLSHRRRLVAGEGGKWLEQVLPMRLMVKAKICTRGIIPAITGLFTSHKEEPENKETEESEWLLSSENEWTHVFTEVFLFYSDYCGLEIIPSFQQAYDDVVIHKCRTVCKTDGWPEWDVDARTETTSGKAGNGTTIARAGKSMQDLAEAFFKLCHANTDAKTALLVDPTKICIRHNRKYKVLSERLIAKTKNEEFDFLRDSRYVNKIRDTDVDNMNPMEAGEPDEYPPPNLKEIVEQNMGNSNNMWTRKFAEEFCHLAGTGSALTAFTTAYVNVFRKEECQGKSFTTDGYPDHADHVFIDWVKQFLAACQLSNDYETPHNFSVAMDDLKVKPESGDPIKLQQAVKSCPIFQDVEYYEKEIKRNILPTVSPEVLATISQTAGVEARVNALIGSAFTMKKVPDAIIPEFIEYLKVTLVPKVKREREAFEKILRMRANGYTAPGDKGRTYKAEPNASLMANHILSS